MSSWPARREAMIGRYRAFGRAPTVPISNPSGSVVIMHAHFEPFEGSGTGLPYAVLGLCTDGGGPARKCGPGFEVEDVWKPGKIGLSLPDQPASGNSPRMGMLGIAFDPGDVPACHGGRPGGDRLARVANRMFDDPIAAWMMTALWRDAEAHGASSSFFDHGLSLLLHRLVNLVEPLPETSSLVGGGRLALVMALIEERLGEDLRVKEMAPVAGMDTRSLTRAFKRETGCTPFAYLTRRRMERAKTLLREGASVTETAMTVGYANPAKFAAAFKRWLGRSPSQWCRSSE